jgi:GNAT superfamily N-acetyltransferase
MFGREYAMFPHSVSVRDARATVGDAYAGSSSHPGGALSNWILEPLRLRHKELVDVSRSTNGYSLNDLLQHRGGVLFGIKTETTKVNEGKLKACAIFREYDPNTADEGCKLGPFKRFTSLMCRTCAFLHMQIQPKDAHGASVEPPKEELRRDIEGYERRAEYIEEKLTEWHKIHGPSTSHWHLTDIAVIPEAQNQGLGTELMATLHTLADHYKADCYLECAGEKNAAFFSRFGFIVAGKEKLCFEESPTNVSPTTVYLKVRTSSSITIGKAKRVRDTKRLQ